MYITITGTTPRIERVSMDGTSRSNLLSGLSSPSSLTIDYSQDLLLWADTQLNQIESTSFDGLNRSIVYSASNLPTNRDPQSISIHGDTLYFIGLFVGVYAIRTDPSSRLLHNIGCSLSDGIQVVSSGRQASGKYVQTVSFYLP